MSTVIRSCPGCKSLILSDTDQCPECGHVFYERKNRETTTPAPGAPETLKTANITEACPHCGEMVRSGLVRCWSCNGFMREDVAARFRDLTSNPQKIVYSTIPIEDRTDYLPPRADAVKGVRQKVYDADDFTLDDETPVGNSGSVRRDSRMPSQPHADAAKLKPAALEDGPDKPRTTTPGARQPSKDETTRKSDAKSRTAGDAASNTNSPAVGGGDSDDLLSIALQEEREVRKRRSEKLAEREKKRMLVSCACGAWVRVHEDKAGKMVRCRQCKQPVSIPEIRRKAEKKEEKSAAPRLNVTWINDVWFHMVSPTSLVLKPGSLIDKHTEADIAFTESGLHIVAFGGAEKKKKSLLSFGSSDKKADRSAHRQQIRNQVTASGGFANLQDADVKTVGSEQIGEIRLVQPIAKAHESMFAGVPVFGEGRIAIFVPIASEDGPQAFFSFPLSSWRLVAERMKTLFGLEIPTVDNGVPATEKTDTLSCFVNQSKVESIRSLVYYQKDPAFQLELTGYRCKSCGTVISEAGRSKNKLGGANGKAIAKAKCPKCSAKMGEEPLYKIKKSAEAATPDSH